MDFGTIPGLTDATIQGIDLLCNTGAGVLGVILATLAFWARANQPCSKQQEQTRSIWAAAKQ